MHIIYFALQQKSQSNHGLRWENIWKKKALVLYLRNECSTSYRDIAKKCLISKSSAERIYKESLKVQLHAAICRADTDELLRDSR